jgi:hypothetical protein
MTRIGISPKKVEDAGRGSWRDLLQSPGRLFEIFELNSG